MKAAQIEGFKLSSTAGFTRWFMFEAGFGFAEGKHVGLQCYPTFCKTFLIFGSYYDRESKHTG